MPKPNKFDLPRDLRWTHLAIASEAKCDSRVVSDYITGRRNTRPAQREAIERALRDMGRADLIRAEAE
jgi:hypothetical protein